MYLGVSAANLVVQLGLYVTFGQQRLHPKLSGGRDEEWSQSEIPPPLPAFHLTLQVDDF